MGRTNNCHFVLFLTKQGGLWLGMTGGQVRMNVKPIGAFKSGPIRHERRGLKIQGPLY